MRSAKMKEDMDTEEDLKKVDMDRSIGATKYESPKGLTIAQDCSPRRSMLPAIT